MLGEKLVRRHIRKVPERTDEQQVLPGPFGLSTETGSFASFSHVTRPMRLCLDSRPLGPILWGVATKCRRSGTRRFTSSVMRRHSSRSPVKK